MKKRNDKKEKSLRMQPLTDSEKKEFRGGSAGHQRVKIVLGDDDIGSLP